MAFNEYYFLQEQAWCCTSIMDQSQTKSVLEALRSIQFAACVHNSCCRVVSGNSKIGLWMRCYYFRMTTNTTTVTTTFLLHLYRPPTRWTFRCLFGDNTTHNQTLQGKIKNNWKTGGKKWFNAMNVLGHQPAVPWTQHNIACLPPNIGHSPTKQVIINDYWHLCNDV